jgi:hypothetical protein
MRLCLNTPLKACLLFLCLPAFGQTHAARESTGSTQHIEMDDDPSYILEVGAATSWTRGLSSNGTENLHKELADGLSNKPRFDGKL